MNEERLITQNVKKGVFVKSKKRTKTVRKSEKKKRTQGGAKKN